MRPAIWQLVSATSGADSPGFVATIGPGAWRTTTVVVVSEFERTVHENRYLPVPTDYRSLLGGLTARQFGPPRKHVAVLFPKARPVDLKRI